MISKFQYITSEMFDFTHHQLAEEVCKAGGDWIQLRLKNTTHNEFLKIAIETQIICKKYNARLIINDNVNIAREINADGVHIGKLDMSPSEARRILGNNFIIGCTANTFEDIKKLTSERIDYIGLGPFRYTPTKENLSEILGIEGYRRVIIKCKNESINIPLIAVGGITIKDIETLMEAGIYGIAISSSINHAKNKQTQTRRILNKINKMYDAKP